jgi:hypothetical protein
MRTFQKVGRGRWVLISPSSCKTKETKVWLNIMQKTWQFCIFSCSYGAVQKSTRKYPITSRKHKSGDLFWFDECLHASLGMRPCLYEHAFLKLHTCLTCYHGNKVTLKTITANFAVYSTDTQTVLFLVITSSSSLLILEKGRGSKVYLHTYQNDNNRLIE